MGRRRSGARHPRVVRLVVVLAALTLASCATRSEKKNSEQAGSKHARILQFYARDAVVPLGEKTMLCYGVESAKKVRLAPAVESIWPALTRCVEIAPSKETTYALTAEGADGQPVEQSVTVKIGAPVPRIIEVSVNAINVHPKEQVNICYQVKNAATVKVAPGRSLNTGVVAPGRGCAVDMPVKTTTYTVTAIGTDGKTDTEHVTVTVK